MPPLTLTEIKNQLANLFTVIEAQLPTPPTPEQIDAVQDLLDALDTAIDDRPIPIEPEEE